jgi:Glycosyl hydrolase family 115/Gylcosyl hydrolase family 115 C-terminal domain
MPCVVAFAHLEHAMHLSRSALIVAGGLAASLFVVPIGAGIGNAASATLGRHPVSAGSTKGGVGGSLAAGGYISTSSGGGDFALVAAGSAAPMVVSSTDYPGVARAAGDLRADIGRVTGAHPTLSKSDVPQGRDLVLIGTIGHSPLIDNLVAKKKLDVSGIAGKWETSIQEVVQNPMPGVRRAFVIAGSDQRGTIYGTYDVSKGIGVSPWHWWDDVTPGHQDALYVLPGRHTQGTPVVKYRGFFINDENPASGEWAPGVFGPGKDPKFPGGFNHDYYAKNFELALRLKANYIWPAVWGKAFEEDDPQNQATATAYGIVMGTSHEAPMMRGIEEWNRHAVPAVRDSSGNITTPGHDPYGGTGEWSFVRNPKALKAFWTDGIKRMVQESAEGVVTLGMRGNGDTALPDGTGIDLMKTIIDSQRQILRQVKGKDVTTTPQVWTLYKEVLRYWDKGLRPPDDVTVVFTDDNWGNIRQLPDQKLPPRAGGYGLYYHFDYVGGGRDYKWVDTASMQNTWDQLHQAYSYGDSRLWMANVGDVKNNEEPLSFFLDYAWNPNALPLDKIGDWERQYAAESFGSQQAGAIADVLNRYGQLQSRRKPELLNRKITLDPAKDLSTDPSAVVYDDQATPFSLTNYQELDRATGDWQQLATRAEAIGQQLPEAKRAAYYELVLYEVKATANLYALRDAEFTNILYAKQGRALTNQLADVAQARFADDQAMSAYYNNTLSGGKWKGFQTQPHIDYGDIARYGPNAPWQQPELNNVALPDVIFPALQRIQLPNTADMGVAIDGSDHWWPQSAAPAVLPAFSPYQGQPAQYIDVFNRGSVAFDYSTSSAQPWLSITPNHGTVDKQVRVTLRVDWRHAPKGTVRVPITVTGPSGSVVVQAVVDNPAVAPGDLKGFVEANGYVSMEAAHYTYAVNSNGVSWTKLPDIGRTDSGMEPFPVTAPIQTPGGNSPHLEYAMTTFSSGPVKVSAYLSPRNDVLAHGGLRYAISIDNEAPQIVDINTATGSSDATMNRPWERNTSDNVNLTVTTHKIAKPGAHVVKFWMVDPTVLVQKLTVDMGGIEPSYLGPPESLQVGSGR